MNTLSQIADQFIPRLSPSLAWSSADRQPPASGHLVLYRTKNYQALGFQEQNGLWRTSNGEIEPEPVLWWSEI